MMNVKRVATIALAVTGLLMVCAAFARPGHVVTPVQPTISSVALQLGVKVPPPESDTFGVGVSFTGLLEKPEKLAAFGIADMQQGARVVVMRVALDRVVVEVDQLEPPRSARAKLALDVAGRLSAAPRT
jgi:hypothetical protein